MSNKTLTVRRLRGLLDQVPEDAQGLPVYASYDGGYRTGIYEFDPLDVVVTEGWRDDIFEYVKLPGDH